MRFLITILLFLVFGYSLMLVIVNNQQVDVNLLFSNAPQMNLGLLLIICIVLGVVAGLLLGLILFRVLQMKLETQRLNKELKQTQEKLMQSQHNLEQYMLQHKDTGLPINTNQNNALPPV
ncbi:MULTISPECIES: LapA family protein [unclassified Moraxella]|uniref:LapA family protein n=1 Tax=unclassified Moraxella TaxID=2685852 RepID=UPI003AF95C8E